MLCLNSEAQVNEDDLNFTAAFATREMSGIDNTGVRLVFDSRGRMAVGKKTGESGELQ